MADETPVGMDRDGNFLNAKGEVIRIAPIGPGLTTGPLQERLDELDMILSETGPDENEVERIRREARQTLARSERDMLLGTEDEGERTLRRRPSPIRGQGLSDAAPIRPGLSNPDVWDMNPKWDADATSKRLADMDLEEWARERESRKEKDPVKRAEILANRSENGFELEDGSPDLAWDTSPNRMLATRSSNGFELPDGTPDPWDQPSPKDNRPPVIDPFGREVTLDMGPERPPGPPVRGSGFSAATPIRPGLRPAGVSSAEQMRAREAYPRVVDASERAMLANMAVTPEQAGSRLAASRARYDRTMGSLSPDEAAAIFGQLEAENAAHDRALAVAAGRPTGNMGPMARR